MTSTQIPGRLVGPIERATAADLSTPYWFADLLRATAQRDPVDVMHAAVVFLKIARERCDAVDQS